MVQLAPTGRDRSKMGRLPFVDCSLENGLLMASRRDLDDGKKILQPE